MSDMKDFLNELADLLEKYDVELQPVDDGETYYPSVSGIDFDMRGHYEKGEQIRPFSSCNSGTVFVDSEVLRNLAKKV